jgi:hypothetical protein
MAGIGSAKALVFLLLGATMSGCIVAESAPTDKSTQAGQPAPEAAEPATFDETTGAISGLVVNAEGLPIGGALAGIRETSAQTVADVGGTFTFSNLPPGDYSLDISQLGYESTSKRVTVSAGEISHVNVALTEVAVEGPYYETILENGNVQCSVRAYPGVPTTTMSGLPPWTTGVAVCGLVSLPGFEPDRFLVTYELPAGAIELMAEMAWQSTQATGSALGFALEIDGRSNDPDATYGSPRGRSPLILPVNETKMQEVDIASESECIPEGCSLQTRVFAEAETTGLATPVPLGPFPDPLGDPADRVDFGITLDQRYVMYLTHFHVEGMPDGYSALGDS